MATCDFLVPV